MVYPEEIGSLPIHFIDKGNPGNPVLLSLPPNRFRLSFNTPYRTEKSNRTVKNPQRPFHLNGEIDVTGGVDDVDLVLLILIIPERGRGSRCYGNPPLLFLFHPVHSGSAIMYLTHAVS